MLADGILIFDNFRKKVLSDILGNLKIQVPFFGIP